MSGITDPAYLERRRTSILSAEGDEHTRLRRLVGKAFSPRAADRLRPFMREVIDGLVDEVAPRGRADVAVDICEPYPIPIICELLGAPKEDWKQFSRWATDVLRIFNGNLAVDLPTIVAAQDELDAYTRELIADRRDKPAEDLITDLIAAEEEGDKLSDRGAGDDGRGGHRRRHGHDAQPARLRRGPVRRVPRSVGRARRQPRPRASGRSRRAMRYFGAVRGTGRFASEDIEYRDVLFPAGTFIAPAMATANRDATVFERPDVFDITRQPSGQPQLTFGSGIHYCLGAALARAELQEALPLLARRMPDLALDGEVTWKPDAVGIFGPDHLPVTFTPGH